MQPVEKLWKAGMDHSASFQELRYRLHAWCIMQQLMHCIDVKVGIHIFSRITTTHAFLPATRSTEPPRQSPCAHSSDALCTSLIKVRVCTAHCRRPSRLMCSRFPRNKLEAHSHVNVTFVASNMCRIPVQMQTAYPYFSTGDHWFSSSGGRVHSTRGFAKLILGTSWPASLAVGLATGIGSVRAHSTGYLVSTRINATPLPGAHYRYGC